MNIFGYKLIKKEKYDLLLERLAITGLANVRQRENITALWSIIDTYDERVFNNIEYMVKLGNIYRKRLMKYGKKR